MVSNSWRCSEDIHHLLKNVPNIILVVNFVSFDEALNLAQLPAYFPVVDS